MYSSKTNKVKFTGWESGARKIKFTMLLHEEGGLSLKAAKAVKDKVIGGGEVVELDFKNPKTAELIYQQAKALGVKCSLVFPALEDQKM